MPVMDGIEATREIRRLERAAAGPLPSPSVELPEGLVAPATPFHSSVIIVALTASPLQSDRVQALAAGCNDFLTKPVPLPWLDKKIIEWGSIKALQMWAAPEVTREVDYEQAVKGKAVRSQLQLPASIKYRGSPQDVLTSSVKSMPNIPNSDVLNHFPPKASLISGEENSSGRLSSTGVAEGLGEGKLLEPFPASTGQPRRGNLMVD